MTSPTALAPATAAPATGLAVTVCRDPREFAGLAEEWSALHRRCPQATPFQTHAWLHSWWLSYATGRDRLRTVLVRRQGVLVGAAPLLRTHRPLPVLLPLGGDITDYADVLVAADDTPSEVVAALALGIRRAARGAVVDLREVRPGAAALALFDAWHGPKRRSCDSVCLELPGLPMDGLIARVGSSRGQRIRAHLRRLDAAGVEERDVAAQEVPAAVATMLRLHRMQWQGRGVTPEHVRPRFAEHLSRAATAMVAAGEAVVTEFSIGGTVVAANLTVLSPALAGGYLYGAHPGLRGRKVDVTTLLIRHSVRHVAGAGRPVLTLLRGAEPHKSHWRPAHLANQRLLLANRPLAPVLHARHALAAARTRLLRTAADRLPALKAWRARLNDLRARRA
ncbi:GNAT family N-acetyltransferase [Streptomyces sp. NPDC049040]|uniref:GNAT family N-acetyltransferase n=1 Tax=Streptomyces sp. NPDC049040 TaxID=3365593 RepID=UPI00371F5FE9